MLFARRIIPFIFFLGAVNLQSATADDNVKQQLNSLGLYESLYSAIAMDSEAEVEQFIQFGANINHRYKGGKTPLMHASSMGSIKSVHKLLEHGAKSDLLSNEKMTALDYARAKNNNSIIIALQVDDAPEQPQSKTQLVSTIQLYLNRLGYIAGDIDGIYGTKTRNSLKQFSIDFQQEFPIEISPKQVAKLYDAMSKEDSENISENYVTEINVEFADSETDIPGQARKLKRN